MSGFDVRLMDSRVGALRAIEAEAAQVADALAATLRLPRSGRPPSEDASDRLKRLLELARQSASQLRRDLGQSTPPRNSPAFEAARYLRELRVRFRLWSGIISAVQQVARGRTWPLFPRRRSRLDLGGVQQDISDHVFTRMHRAVNPVEQSDSAAELGCFADIPARVSLFLEHAHLAYRVLMAQRHGGPIRFLDIGCGGGTKVVLASQLFSTSDGLEYDAAYAVAARRTLAAVGASRSDIIEGDALTFQRYGDYDVLYMYRPLRDDAKLKELERRVLEQGRRGAVMIAPYLSFLDGNTGFSQIRHGVFVLGMSRSEGAALKREVLRIGPHIANPDDLPPPEVGWLRPLWRACEMNGISPAAYAGGITPAPLA